MSDDAPMEDQRGGDPVNDLEAVMASMTVTDAPAGWRDAYQSGSFVRASRRYVDGSRLVTWNPTAEELARRLVDRWRRELQDGLLSNEILAHVLHHAAKARLGGFAAAKVLPRLRAALQDPSHDSLVMTALTGVEWAGEPRHLADGVVIGRAGDAFEASLDRVAWMSGALGFSFPSFGDEPWWLEDLAAQREDPDAFSYDADLSFPVLIGAAVSSPGNIAWWNFTEILDRIAGAAEVAAMSEPRPTSFENWTPIETLEHRDQLKLDDLRRQSSDLPAKYGVLYRAHPTGEEFPTSNNLLNLPLEAVLDRPQGVLVRVAASSMPIETPALDAQIRVGAACSSLKHQAGVIADVVALETLIPATRWKGKGKVTEAFCQGVQRLLPDHAAGIADDRTLGDLYDHRSSLVHEGQDGVSLESSGRLHTLARQVVAEVLPRYASLVEAGVLTDDQSIVDYLNASA